MTKELTPLVALMILKETIFHCTQGCLFTEEEKALKVIETALKDYEKKTKLAKEYADVNNVAKRLKAFEIIKEKGCSYIEKDLIVACKNYEEYCIEMNSNMVYRSRYLTKEAFKTQEEFDLLKEVLL